MKRYAALSLMIGLAGCMVRPRIPPLTPVVVVQRDQERSPGTDTLASHGANTTSQVSFSWINPGPRNLNGLSGKLQAFAFVSSQPQVMYAGGGNGSGIEGPFTQAGVFKSTDGGVTWTSINNGFTDTAVNVLWMDQANPSTLLAGTEYGGLFRTANGGQSWARVLPNSPVSAILTVSNGILAGTGRGFELSTDGGLTWSLLQATASPVRCLATGGNYILAGLERGDVLLKRPSDSAWQTVATNPQYSIWDVAVDPVNPQVAFYIRNQGPPNPPYLFRTTDGGNSWQGIDAPTGIFSQTIAVRPSDSAVLIAGEGRFYKSLDSGRTWTQLNGPGDSRKIYLIPVTSSLVIGSDQGLHWTDNDGTSWRNLSGPISASILFGVDVHGQTIIASAQDFGPVVTLDGGSTWIALPISSQSGLFEGGGIAINPANPTYCYAFTGGGFSFSQDGCASFNHVNQPTFQNYVAAANQNLITVDPRNPSTVYVGASDGVWRSTDWGRTLQHLTWPFQQITQIVLDPKDPLAIYVCTTSGLYQSLNGGTTWTKLVLPSSVYPYSATVSPANSNVLLIALSAGAGRPQGGVLRSMDRGVTFQFVNQGLSTALYNLGNDQLSIAFNPDVPPGTDPLLALATSGGPYLSSDLGTTWQSIRFNAIPFYFGQVHWDGGYLWATTYGQGILRSDRQLTSVPQFAAGVSHIGNFTQGQNGAAYTITLQNTGTGPGSGIVNVTDVLPPGMAAATIDGTGWNCVVANVSCIRSDSLPAGSAYPAITLTVNVGPDAASSAVNQVNIVGGGAIPSNATDITTILSPFVDVSPSDSFLPAIDLLRQYAITSGCATTPPMYCPTDNITRSQMAVFVVRSIMGGDSFTYTTTPYFSDVPSSDPLFKWVQKMRDLGITSGCGTAIYCPSAPVTRGEMAVFIIRSRFGSKTSFNSPSTPSFIDVGAENGFFPWIQKMKQLGITSGCGTTTYCPGDPVTREQMAAFLMRGAFNQLLPAGAPVIVSASPAGGPPVLDAAILYQTGFEPPTFSTGGLGGQDGWNIIGSSSLTVVETSDVKSGTQAVGVRPSTATLDGAGRGTPYDATGQVLTFAIDAKFSDTGTPSFWTVLSTNFNSSPGNIDFNIDPNGQIHIFTTGTDHPTGVKIARGVWSHYEMDVDLLNHTVNAFYNNAPVLQGAQCSSSATTLGGYAFYSQPGGGAGADQAFFDNLSMTASAAPQPHTVTVTLAGQNTNWVNGTTRVSTGPGITVANVEVLNPTTLTAQLVIAADATPGPYSLTAITGAEEATLPNGFIVH